MHVQQSGDNVEESTGKDRFAVKEDHSAQHRVNGILNVFHKNQLHSLLSLLSPLLQDPLDLDAFLTGDNVEELTIKDPDAALLQDHSAPHRANGILNVFHTDQLHSLHSLLNLLLQDPPDLAVFLTGDNAEE
jgi:hypothetical protein